MKILTLIRIIISAIFAIISGYMWFKIAGNGWGIIACFGFIVMLNACNISDNKVDINKLKEVK